MYSQRKLSKMTKGNVASDADATKTEEVDTVPSNSTTAAPATADDAPSSPTNGTDAGEAPSPDAAEEASDDTTPHPKNASQSVTFFHENDYSVPSSAEAPRCVLDRTLVNEETFPKLQNLGLAVFAPLCGLNRGAFVLDPPDGATYGCAAFPPNFAQLADVVGTPNATSPVIKDSNAIDLKYKDGNITAGDAVNAVDFFVRAVFHSTADVKVNTHACDASGIIMLQCNGKTDSSEYVLPGMDDGSKVRAVTLAGLFVPAPWATGGKTAPLTAEEIKAWYVAKDFDDMKMLGLNAVQIPVPLQMFSEGTGDESLKGALGDILSLAEGAGLRAIVMLIGDDVHESKKQDKAEFAPEIQAAATYLTTTVTAKNVVALTLPYSTEADVKAARAGAPSLPLLLPTNVADLSQLTSSDPNVYTALDLSHTTTVADVASSTSLDDRMKLFYHESISCSRRSPIEYAACERGMPSFVSMGFDLSIDDCIHAGTDTFRDYGQCDRFNETVDSPWWESHRASFAERQVYAYERGLGWSFAAWKLMGDNGSEELVMEEGTSDGNVTSSTSAAIVGAIDSPAKLLSFRDVAAAGLIPPLTNTSSSSSSSGGGVALVCLNGPETDFVLGDATMAPTPAPPPACDGGWWSPELGRCDYWVPPAPCPKPLTAKSVGFSMVGGGVAGMALAAIGSRMLNRGKGGYSVVPDITV